MGFLSDLLEPASIRYHRFLKASCAYFWYYKNSGLFDESDDSLEFDLTVASLSLASLRCLCDSAIKGIHFESLIAEYLQHKWVGVGGSRMMVNRTAFQGFEELAVLLGASYALRKSYPSDLEILNLGQGVFDEYWVRASSNGGSGYRDLFSEEAIKAAAEELERHADADFAVSLNIQKIKSVLGGEYDCLPSTSFSSEKWHKREEQKRIAQAERGRLIQAKWDSEHEAAKKREKKIIQCRYCGKDVSTHSVNCWFCDKPVADSV